MAAVHERTTPSLPERFYMINTGGFYYSGALDLVSFRKKVPDWSCEITVEYRRNNPEEFFLKTHSGKYLKYHPKKPSHIYQDKKGKTPIPFTLLDIEPNVYVFRSADGSFLQPSANEKSRMSLGSYDKSIHVKIEDAALKRSITNFAYQLGSSKITDLPVEIALKSSLRNDSPTQNVSLPFEYFHLKSHKGTWKNAIGTEFDFKKYGGNQIPFLTEGTVQAIVHTELKGADSVEKVQTKSSVIVPPKQKGVLKVLIYRARIDVPFTYTETIWYRSGAPKKNTMKGIYSNVETIGTEVMVSDLIGI